MTPEEQRRINQATLRLVDPKPTAPAVDECDAAAKIAECLREQAERMPLDSKYQALALRSAARWGRLAGSWPRPLNLAAVAPTFASNQHGDGDDR
jgi:hypothetical protein